MQRRKGSVLILPLILVLTAVIGGYLVFKNQIYLKSLAELLPIPAPIESETENNLSGFETFRSEKLRISFKYAFGVGVKEVANKVYVYQNGNEPTRGQWVEVFDKAVSDTFEQAIKKTILKDAPNKECLVEMSNNSSGRPPNFIYAVISVPEDEKDNTKTFFEKHAKCSKDYFASGGPQYYFAYDKNHPTKFLYFNIGSYRIIADFEKNLTWQETIEIF